jgi:S1-C subfamily serine protease
VNDDDDSQDDLPIRRRRPVVKAKKRWGPLMWTGVSVSGLVAVGAIVAAIWAVIDTVNAPRRRNDQGVHPGPALGGGPMFAKNNFGNQDFFDPFGDKGPEADAARRENWVQFIPAHGDESLEPTASLTVAQARELLPKEPMPADMAPETVQKVKRATTYLRVERPDGRIGTGSGFFALEPGIVMTNAHVVGMLDAREPAPKNVDVVINSGEPDEKKFPGTVLGVDRTADLAVLRVPKSPHLPAPLKVQSAASLSEVQKVFIFGFPYGEQLSKQITVNTSSVSQLRKDRFGSIDRVQVNGGMNPGNSGGPVADARGDVVAVSVSMIAYTAINFAVPGDFVRSAMHGRVHSTRTGYPIQDGKQVKMSYELSLLDPLQKVRKAKVEYWYGRPGPSRPQTRIKPKPRPGDGPKLVLDLSRDEDKARGSLLLTPPDDDKILFTQPLLVSAGGETIWGTAKPHLRQATVERRPAMLIFKNHAQGRKLHLDACFQLSYAGTAGGSRLETEMDEDVQPEGATATASLRYNRVRVGSGDTGFDARLARAARSMRGGTTVFAMDAKGEPTLARHESADGVQGGAMAPGLAELQNQIVQAFSLAAIPLENRQLKPDDSWNVERTIYMAMPLGEQGTFKLTYNYEGVRRRAGREEALVRIAGTVRTPPGQQGQISHTKGTAHGQAVFDLATGQFTLTRFEANLNVERAAQGLPGTRNGRVSFPVHLLFQLSRRLGTMPVAPREIFRKEDKLAANDPKDLVQPGHHKMFKVPMKAGKTYVIDMVASADAAGQVPSFDPYLRLEDPRGIRLDEDDDSGGGLNSQILFHPLADGEYRIITTTFGPDQTGDFTLTVREG